jgi:basic amino acid/polyamine antiporter, APA family
MDSTIEAASPKAPSPKKFGLATAVFVVVSSMIGTGVLTTSGFTVYYVGSNQLMLALWVLGGVIAICGALTLCELSAALPRSGGDYVYLYEAYGPLAAFLSGWVSFFIGFGGPIALSASAAAKYLLAPARLSAHSSASAQLVLASLIIVALGVVHCLGRTSTISAQGGMTALKLGILTVLAGALLVGGWGRFENLADRPPITPRLLTSMASSMVYISYAYTGWNGAAYLAGEVEQPQRRMPRAILVGTGLVLLLYVALNVGYSLALSASDIQQLVKNNHNDDSIVAPIAEIAVSRLHGHRLSDPLSIAIGLTLLASVSAYVLTGPRVAYAMALTGQFPSFAGKLSERTGAPVIATALQVAWALILLWTASFNDLLKYAGVGLALFSMLTVSTVYVLRWRRPELHRPFRTPGYPVVPAVYLGLSAALVAAVFHRDAFVASCSVLSILAGVPVYYAWKLTAKPKASSDLLE